jgi:prevent-host-death family protein
MLSTRPISDLRNHFSEVNKIVNSKNESIIFTVNGKASMAVMSFDRYSKMAHLDYVERALDEADTYAENQEENLTHDEVFSKIKAKINV